MNALLDYLRAFGDRAQELGTDPQNYLAGLLSSLPDRNSLQGAVKDPEFYKGLLSNTKEMAGGLLTGAVGAPVDIATMMMRPGGYNVPDKRVVGSSNHLAGLLGLDAESTPYKVGSLLPTDAGDAAKYVGLLGPTVFHGTQAVRRSGDAMESAIELQARLGGKKVMDGLGPHVGTADAANDRLRTFHGLPKNVWDKPDAVASEKLRDAYVMKFDMEPQKQFVRKDGSPFTETELQQKLKGMAKKLGYDVNDPAKLRQAQLAVREQLRSEGYDAIPYVNSHEARGSVSWVVLNPDLLK